MDLRLIAESGQTSIWHTDSTIIPPRSTAILRPSRLLFRGFWLSQLESVLQNGTDVPPHAAFYAEGFGKAWDYARRAPDGFVAVLALDRSSTLPSFQVRPPIEEDPEWQPDRTLYPQQYTDRGLEVFTRFDSTRLPSDVRDEEQYGHWIPGDNRAALLHILLGGDRIAIQNRLTVIARSGLVPLDLVD